MDRDGFPLGVQIQSQPKKGVDGQDCLPHGPNLTVTEVQLTSGSAVGYERAEFQPILGSVRPVPTFTLIKLDGLFQGEHESQLPGLPKS